MSTVGGVVGTWLGLLYTGVVQFTGVQLPFHRPVMQQESIDMLVSAAVDGGTGRCCGKFVGCVVQW